MWFNSNCDIVSQNLALHEILYQLYTNARDYIFVWIIVHLLLSHSTQENVNWLPICTSFFFAHRVWHVTFFSTIFLLLLHIACNVLHTHTYTRLITHMYAMVNVCKQQTSNQQTCRYSACVISSTSSCSFQSYHVSLYRCVCMFACMVCSRIHTHINTHSKSFCWFLS